MIVSACGVLQPHERSPRSAGRDPAGSSGAPSCRSTDGHDPPLERHARLRTAGRFAVHARKILAVNRAVGQLTQEASEEEAKEIAADLAADFGWTPRRAGERNR
jgi:hypothetical protein